MTRAAGAPLALVLRRAYSRPGRGLLVALGIAVSSAVLGAVAGGALIASELGVRRALESLPAAQRSFAVGWFGLPPQSGFGAIDADARRALAGLTRAPPSRALIFPELNLGGHVVNLRAVDAVSAVARLRSGRLPRTCRPARCEVVAVRGVPAERRIAEPGLRMVRVGTVDLHPGVDLAAGGGGSQPAPLLLAQGVEAVSSLPAFSSLYRSYRWSADVRPADVHVWGIDALLDDERRAQEALDRVGILFDLAGPGRQLLAARDRGSAAERRMLLVGGGAAALLLGFVLLAGVGTRRDARAEWARLERRGATALQLGLFAGSEALGTALAGVLAGGGAAALAIAVVARRAGVPAGAELAHSLLSPTGIALLAGAWLLAAALLLLAQRASPAARLGPFALGDLVALVAVGAVLLAAARGAVGADALARGGADPLLLLMPPLVSLAAGLAVARLVGPVFRRLASAGASLPPAPRLALLSLGRAEGRAPLVAAFLAVSLGLALFAQAYRATLAAGERDQAAFQVPLDVTVREGARLVRPLEAAPLSDYRALAAGGPVLSVLRMSATVPSSGLRPTSVSVLGVPAQGLAELHGWRDDFADASPAALGRRIAPPRGMALRGAPLDDARSLALRASTSGRAVRLAVDVETRQGGFETVQLGEVGRLPRLLAAPLPADAVGGRVVALSVGLTAADAQSAAHASAEGGRVTLARGVLRLGDLRSGAGQTISDWSGFDGFNGLTPSGAAGGETVRYAVGGAGAATLRPPQPSDGAPVAVLASPDVAAGAAAGGRIALTLPDGRLLPARVVATVRRFPTLHSSFAVADESWLATSVNAGRPGSAIPAELWIGAPPAARASLEGALRRPPFSALEQASRHALEVRLAGDPLARGILLALAAAALAAVVLAVAGLVVAVRGAAWDEQGQLYDLEVQGLEPVTLRRELRLRALLLLTAGLAGALPLGVVLASWVVGLVRLGAGSAPPEPPLVVRYDWPLLAAGVVAVVFAAALAAVVVTRTALRGALPARPRGGAP